MLIYHLLSRKQLNKSTADQFLIETLRNNAAVSLPVYTFRSYPMTLKYNN